MMTISMNTGGDPKMGLQRNAAHETLDTSAQQTRERDRRIAREQTEALLDEALSETFPASDPVAITPKKYDSK